MNVMEAIEESPFASILSSLHDGSFTEVSVVARLISLLLFCISAFVFNYIILRAMEEDESAAAPVWQCSCGRVNQDNVSTCVCGAHKHTTTAPNTRVNVVPPVTQPIVSQPIIQPVVIQPESVPSAEQPTNENAKHPDAPSAHIFCSECGYECPAQAKFCRSCGSRLL